MLTKMVLWIVFSQCYPTESEIFPSLLTANASLAIVIDRGYLEDEYDSVKADIEEYLLYAKSEILKHGGINIHFYSWSAINVRKDLTAILSIAPCSDTWRLFHSTEGEDLVHMAITESDCPRLPTDTSLTVPLIGRGQELPQLLLDLRIAGVFEWKSVVIIYDTTLNTDMTTRIIKSLTQPSNYAAKATSISLIKLKRNISKTNLKSILSMIDPKTVGGNFLVLASYYLVGTIMDYSKSLNLVDIRKQWLYVISDTDRKYHDMHVFRNMLKEGDNVAFIYNTTVLSSNCVGGRKCQIEEIIEAFTRALDEAVQEESDTASQIAEEEWEAIRPTKVERKEFLLGKIKKYISKNGICDNCTFWEMKTGETWGQEYQNLGRNITSQLIPVGTWRPSDGATMFDELFLHIAHGFRKKILPMVTFHNPPWQILSLNESGGVTEYKGLVFDIIRELAKNLNFTFKLEVVNKSVFLENTTIKSSSHNIIGNSLTNRIPVYILNMTKNKVVFLGACAVTITEDLKYVINFTRPISTQTHTFLVARPRELSRALLFISPFTGDTWLCLAASIVCMGPILYYIHRFSPVYEYKGIPMKGGLSSIQNCIWYMYGALLQQGGMHLPCADSARLLIGSWWLVVLVIATTYCGNLVAFLTFPKIDIPITTLEEMISHKDTVTWSFREGSYLENELKIADEPRFRSVYEGRSRQSNSDISNLVNSIQEGKHVFIDWKIKLQFIMKERFLETGQCDFTLGRNFSFLSRHSLQNRNWQMTVRKQLLLYVCMSV
ncbi:ionotropic receptor 93a isoform X3 [Leptinotarsa decemlineata]|uniref:ionotropic receptor 93a isoform X3 n=1 Tax=Leptinotarsa decemlineata TaxID=7539 RepID=UPI003D305126